MINNILVNYKIYILVNSCNYNNKFILSFITKHPSNLSIIIIILSPKYYHYLLTIYKQYLKFLLNSNLNIKTIIILYYSSYIPIINNILNYIKK